MLYYDSEGNVRAVGAEAMSEGTYEQAEDEGWFKVEWSVPVIRDQLKVLIELQVQASPSSSERIFDFTNCAAAASSAAGQVHHQCLQRFHGVPVYLCAELHRANTPERH